jgi:hypothetical protein
LKHYRNVAAESRALTRISYSKIVSLQTNGIAVRSIGNGSIISEIRPQDPANGIVQCIPDCNSLLCVFEKGNLAFVTSCLARTAFVCDDGNDSIRMPACVLPSQLVLALGRTERDGKCVFGVAKTGHLYIFPVDSGGVTRDLLRELANPLSAVFHGNRLIVGTYSALVVVDPDRRRMCQTVESEPVTALAIWPSFGICVGTANGVVELHSLESLQMVAASTAYNAYHSEHGIRRATNEFADVRTVPHAVTTFDFLNERPVLLSMSNSGELFLWNQDVFPKAHFKMIFPISAACFAGDGSIVLSAIGCLFTIPYFLLFDSKIESQVEEEEQIEAVIEPELPSYNEVAPSKPRKQKTSIQKSDSNLHRPKKRPFISTWQDLVVLQSTIPKSHFVSHSPPELTEPVRLGAWVTMRLKENCEWIEIRRSLHLPRELDPDQAYVEIPGIEMVHALAPTGVCQPPAERRPKRKRKEKGTPTQFLYPKQGCYGAKFEEFNQPSAMRRSLRCPIREPPELPATDTAHRHVEPVEDLSNKRFVIRLPAEVVQTETRKPNPRLTARRPSHRSKPAAQPQTSDGDVSGMDAVTRISGATEKNEIEAKRGVDRFARAVGLSPWNIVGMEPEATQRQASERPARSVDRKAVANETEVTAPSEPRIRVSQVRFVPPTATDFVSIGELDMDEMHRLLEARERVIVFLEPREGRGSKGSRKRGFG